MSSAREIRRAAVIGAGVMGATIAAHLANAGLETLLLDVKPTTLTPDEAARGLTLDHPAVANRAANHGLQLARKSRPPAFFSELDPRRIRTGNLEDDLEQLESADWVIEAIVEDLEIKQDLFAHIASYLDLTAILSTNTSGLSIDSLSASLPAGLRPRFLATHFFNPPRYLPLLEIVVGPETDPEVAETIESFGRDKLGKGIVRAKDTPNFIANRLGVFNLMNAARHQVELGLDVATVDALTGTLIGRPKSATFRTADMVGLDTLCRVADGMADRLDHDPQQEALRPPSFLNAMVEGGLLGQKVKRGFYEKSRSGLLMIDPESLEYSAVPEAPLADHPAAGAARLPLGERLPALTAGDDSQSRFLWQHLRDVLLYAAECVPEISDDLVAIDRALKWGFGWVQGPFELWDTWGVETITGRLEQEGLPLPPLVQSLLDRGYSSFYRTISDQTLAFSPTRSTYEPVDAIPKHISIAHRAKKPDSIVLERSAGRLVHLEDEISVLEFKTKRNTITPELIDFIDECREWVEANGRGWVIGNDADHFCAGANLENVLTAVKAGQYDEIESQVRNFQGALTRLKRSPRPVVVAPRGQTLGGGCEIVLAGDRVCAAAETYLGLVEVGVGLIPAGGGCLELLKRLTEGLVPGLEVDPFPFLRRAFETIGMAKVAGSGREAQVFGFLRANDRVVMNRDQVLHAACDLVRAMELEGYRPPEATFVSVAGQTGLAALRSAIHNMFEGGFITEYDRVVGDRLAWVLSGGELSRPTAVPEEYILNLERQAFMELCHDERTHARMQHLLETGKPLRN